MNFTLARKRRRISQELGLDGRTENLDSHSDALNLPSHILKWNLEQNYEQRPRKQKKASQSLRLPIKTSDGWLEQLPVGPDSGLRDSELSDSSEEIVVATADHDSPNGSQNPSAEYGRTISSVQQLAEAKEELAKLATLLNENPEENIGLLRKVAEFTSSTSSAIRKLGLATQMAVFKDVIPGYRIRPISDTDTIEKLSKDVRKLRSFEQSIVNNYQNYVQLLGRIASTSTNDSSQLDETEVAVAVACAAGMLNSASHFNFRADLIRILVTRLATRQADQSFIISCAAISELFQNDNEGHASLEAVTMITKMVKAKNYRVHEQVINLFLYLRLLTQLNMKGSSESFERVDNPSGAQSAKSKKSRQFRTKSERKLERERKKIAVEMQEADATVSHEQRDQIQGETLRIVFSIYLHILKARSHRLMGSVLEGLVRYAHLINQDFFGDLLETLKELIKERDVESHELDAEDGMTGEDASFSVSDVERYRNNLLCITTAFSLLKGQDAASVATTLDLDLTYFVSHLYQSLQPLAISTTLEEKSSLADSQAHPNLHMAVKSQKRVTVNLHTTIVLLLRSLQAVLLPPNARNVSPQRLAAFMKQALTSSLQMPEKSCLSINSLLTKVAKVQHKKISALWCTDERRGNGVFDPLRTDVEATNPFAATVWEGELFRLHYAPSVRLSSHQLELAVQGE